MSGRTGRPLIIAHRGFSGKHPENTIEAIEAAIGLGVDMVEIDLQETADRRLIAFHDYGLKRLCGARGWVRESSLAVTWSKQEGDLIGGDKAAVFNAEILFPIAEQYGLRGVAFYDIGNSFSNGFSFSEFRQSVGVGGRWMSPFGPLRVGLGFPLNKQPGDETSVLGFSIGSQP